jgi:hypothetical protein
MPLLFVLSILVLGLAGFLWKPCWYLLETEMILYVMGLFVGASIVGCQSGWQFMPMAPLVFVILHFAYGIGSLWGVFRFFMLKGRGMKKPAEIQISR